MSTTEESTRRKVEGFVKVLLGKGIQVLAVDFDLTLLSIHSGRSWKDGVEGLAQHVRPCMKDLLQCAIQRGLFVCIVTFFKQSWLIRELLKLVFSKRIASKIIVQANTIDLLQRQGPDEFVGKEAHLINVFNELYLKQHVVINSKEVVLLDDDEENIRTAIQFGHHACLVPADLNYDTFESFATIIASKIIVQANTIDLLQRQGPDEFVGKEAHLINVFNELYLKQHVVINSKEVVLLDDDEENIRTAIQFGHHACLVPADLNYDTFESFATMLTIT